MMPSMLVVAIACLSSTCLAHPEVKPFDYEIIQLDNYGLSPLFSFGNSHGITTAKGSKVFPGEAERTDLGSLQPDSKRHPHPDRSPGSAMLRFLAGI